MSRKITYKKDNPYRIKRWRKLWARDDSKLSRQFKKDRRLFQRLADVSHVRSGKSRSYCKTFFTHALDVGYNRGKSPQEIAEKYFKHLLVKK